MTEIATISDEQVNLQIQQCSSKVLAYLRKFASQRNHHDLGWAEDALQDATVKALKSKHTYKPEFLFINWFMKIAINSLINIIKSNYRNGVVPHNVEYSEANEFMIYGNIDRSMGPHEINENYIINQADNKMSLELALEILNQLPDTLKEALYKFEVDDMDYESIAEELGISVSAVRVRVCRAKRLAREKAKPFLS